MKNRKLELSFAEFLKVWRKIKEKNLLPPTIRKKFFCFRKYYCPHCGKVLYSFSIRIIFGKFRYYSKILSCEKCNWKYIIF